MSNSLLKSFQALAVRLKIKKSPLPVVHQPIDDPVQKLGWDMVKSLEQDDFFLHYQPQIHLPTGQVLGVETLIRWQHPQLGIVSPATFIPIAEKN